MTITGALLAMAAVQAQAVQTNEVHVSTFTATAWTQGATNVHGSLATVTAIKTKLVNKDFLSLLSGLTVTYTSGTNTITVSNVTFTTKAALILKNQVNGNALPSFYIRDNIGTNVVDYNVSPYLSFTQSATSVRGGTDNLTTGAKSGTEVDILTLTFNNHKVPLTACTLSGFTSFTEGSLNVKGVGLKNVVSGGTGALSGTGTLQGVPGVLTFAFSVGTAKIEVR